MKRKTHRPMDFMSPANRPEEIDESDMVDAVDAEPDNDLDIAGGPVVREPYQARANDTFDSPISTRNSSPLSAEQRFRPAPTAPKSGGSLPYWLAGLAGLVLAAAPSLFWVGASRQAGPFEFEPFIFALLGALGVALFVLPILLIYALRQGGRLAAEAKHARHQAKEMLQPALMATAGAGSAVEAVRHEIEHAAAAAAQARHELVTLSEVLAAETAKLIDTAASSVRTASALTESFAHERESLSALATAMDAQSQEINEAILRQARMVAEASDLAQTQIREAEASLAARAADLVAAAGETSEAARLAGEDLGRQAARLETAGAGVSDQIHAVEDSLAEQRAALVAASHNLRGEQEDFAAQIESQQAQLSEILNQARAGASELQETAAQGSEAVRLLVSQAADQYRDLTDAAAEERDQVAVAALQSVGALSEAMRHERATLEEETRQSIEAMSQAAEDARAAAATQAEAARKRIDELGEAAFAVGQKADQVFEARLGEAQALIESAAQLVDEAAVRVSERMAASMQAARDTVGQLEGLLGEVERRSAQLPIDAQRRSDEVIAAVDQGVGDLLHTARKAAEETQAIDAAFQERVRRNYEMLSEAVRLMGVVGGSATPARPRTSLLSRDRTPIEPPVARTPTPRAPVEATRPEPAPAPDPNAEQIFEPEPVAEQLIEAEPEPAPQTRVAPDVGGDKEEPLNLTADTQVRPRLRLTPTESDDEMSLLFEPAAGREGLEPPADGDGWTWRNLLSGIDGQPANADRLAEKMIDEIDALGIDPGALMPRSRIDEIAAVMQTRDQAGSREVVRRLAPAAVRRLGRRILTDITLRTQVDRFLKRFEGEVDAAIDKDRQGFALAQLLASDNGRAFLLVDAAAGGMTS